MEQTLEILHRLASRDGLEPDEVAALRFAAASLSTVDVSIVASTQDWTGLQPSRPANPAIPDLPEGFEYLGLLGVGGMGTVYRVRETDLNRVMALKVMHDRHASRDGVKARFVEEAQVSAQLVHPGIPAVHRLGILPDGRTYFTMELVQGQTFRDVLEAPHATSQQAQIRLLQQVCEAVGYAHSRGVIHRDLKPANLMVGAFGETLVLDWGLAKLLGVESLDRPVDLHDVQTDRQSHATFETRAGSVLGTPAYMAPEQALGESAVVGPPADVYALGVVLYEVLALGNHPYAHLPIPELLRGLRLGPDLLERHPLSELLDVPPDLLAICRRATLQDPAARYPNAKALAEDLRAWIDGDAGRARGRSILEDARGLPAAVAASRAQAAELARTAEGLKAQIPGGLPIEAKRPLWELEGAAEALRQQAEDASLRVEHLVRAALSHAPDLDEARELLADHIRQEHAWAEQAGDRAHAHRLEVRLRDLDRAGRHKAYLHGGGRVSLSSDPAGAQVDIYKYVLKDRRLQPIYVDTRTTPFQLALPMGSYLAVLTAEGRAEVRYPFEITRNGHWTLEGPGSDGIVPIHLPPAGALLPDERYVPAGWARFGGQTDTFGLRSMLPARRLWMPAFAIQVHHVTIDDYITFLNDLVSTGRRDEALRHQPQTPTPPGQPGVPMLAFDGAGFSIPSQNVYGIPWEGHWPVIFVDWYAACAYAAWKGQRAGLPLRLPWEYEWEKAARGVDGRLFPWGDTLDPTWARMLESHLGMATMAPAGTYEVDESPYGVRDMAGNQRDWCMDIVSPGGAPVGPDGRITGPLLEHPHWDVRVVRGGNFLDAPLQCWASFRTSFLPYVRDYTMSFRTARSLEPGAHHV